MAGNPARKTGCRPLSILTLWLKSTSCCSSLTSAPSSELAAPPSLRPVWGASSCAWIGRNWSCPETIVQSELLGRLGLVHLVLVVLLLLGHHLGNVQLQLALVLLPKVVH